MQEIKAYKTSDGKIFMEKHEAMNHEYADKIKAFIKQNFPPYGIGREEVEDFIIKYFELAKKD